MEKLISSYDMIICESHQDKIEGERREGAKKE